METWFTAGEWLHGWSVKPDESINKELFSKVYSKNPQRWEKAFRFLSETELSKLELKRYDLEGDSLFVMVSEYTTKNIEDAKFEAHKKYIDIQYVSAGNELIGIAPITAKDYILQEYDAVKDLDFFTVKEKTMLTATPENFFIFFPEDAHMPQVKNHVNELVRKIVVKVKID